MVPNSPVRIGMNSKSNDESSLIMAILTTDTPVSSDWVSDPTSLYLDQHFEHQ
jgi:hypothetical protein